MIYLLEAAISCQELMAQHFSPKVNIWIVNLTLIDIDHVVAPPFQWEIEHCDIEWGSCWGSEDVQIVAVTRIPPRPAQRWNEGGFPRRYLFVHAPFINCWCKLNEQFRFFYMKKLPECGRNFIRFAPFFAMCLIELFLCKSISCNTIKNIFSYSDYKQEAKFSLNKNKIYRFRRTVEGSLYSLCGRALVLVILTITFWDSWTVTACKILRIRADCHCSCFDSAKRIFTLISS